MAQIETGTEARQGSKGKPVLYVLVAAIVLAVVAGAGALTWQGASSPPDHASQSQDAARATATGANQPSGSGASGASPTNPTMPSPAQPKAN